MIVGGQTEARAQLSSTIIDYHEPFDQGFRIIGFVCRQKHARGFCGANSWNKGFATLVPRVCVHVRSAEDLSGILNSSVLFHVFKHELRTEGKDDLSYWRAEHEQENISILQRI